MSAGFSQPPVLFLSGKENMIGVLLGFSFSGHTYAEEFTAQKLGYAIFCSDLPVA
jgi:type III secretory pathway component EscT